ncbi:hypothetical protein [Thiobacillus sp. 0-1251]|uniref:hypothetical protein n=1 Tax=Thiobacillus sp. 0-1251 TaxID=1895858 RepID=UPI000AFAA065|nr:hypothetical protein [Thiobacillus sp. 0-1251]
MRPFTMRRFKQCALGLMWAMGMASAPSHAYVVQSLTIEEIGVASGGLGTSGNSALGGELNWVDTSFGPFGFVSAGSTDGKLLMGRRQDAGAFTPGFRVFDDPGPADLFFPNTLNYAPTGWVYEAGPPLMVLQLQGFGVVFLGTDYPMPPDNAVYVPLVQIDETHYYYSVDWTHTLAPSSVALFGTFTWHLEGIATTPEPGTIWLVGGTLLCLLGARYRNIGNARRRTTCLPQ